jgi:V8-like Glu-specific endopeptidase
MSKQLTISLIAALMPFAAVHAQTIDSSASGKAGRTDAKNLKMTQPPGAIGRAERKVKLNNRSIDNGFKEWWDGFSTGPELASPFTSSRVALASHAVKPQSAVGTLSRRQPDGLWYECTATLIRPGIVITTAHCVTDKKPNSIYSDFHFSPGWHYVDNSSQHPHGGWAGKRVYFSKNYIEKKDLEADAADIAVVVLEDKGGRRAGDSAGYLNLRALTEKELAGQMRYTFTTSIGYPFNLDNGERAYRNDASTEAVGFNKKSLAWGTVSANTSNFLVTGDEGQFGASGGPIILNWKIEPKNTGIAAPDSVPNQVVAIKVFGYPDFSVAISFSALVTAETISLVEKACKDFPVACRTK